MIGPFEDCSKHFDLYVHHKEWASNPQLYANQSIYEAEKPRHTNDLAAHGWYVVSLLIRVGIAAIGVIVAMNVPTATALAMAAFGTLISLPTTLIAAGGFAVCYGVYSVALILLAGTAGGASGALGLLGIVGGLTVLHNYMAFKPMGNQVGVLEACMPERPPRN